MHQSFAEKYFCDPERYSNMILGTSSLKLSDARRAEVADSGQHSLSMGDVLGRLTLITVLSTSFGAGLSALISRPAYAEVMVAPAGMPLSGPALAGSRSHSLQGQRYDNCICANLLGGLKCSVVNTDPGITDKMYRVEPAQCTTMQIDGVSVQNPASGQPVPVPDSGNPQSGGGNPNSSGCPDGHVVFGNEGCKELTPITVQIEQNPLSQGTSGNFSQPGCPPGSNPDASVGGSCAYGPPGSSYNPQIQRYVCNEDTPNTNPVTGACEAGANEMNQQLPATIDDTIQVIPATPTSMPKSEVPGLVTDEPMVTMDDDNPNHESRFAAPHAKYTPQPEATPSIEPTSPHEIKIILSKFSPGLLFHNFLHTLGIN
jgi:hypothetical protein